ncbi:MAG TPA: hypothetical protein VMV40_08705 [Acidiferrobacter sp.]|nr:hypothetical protein [Acidiferrobacter sp.]
MALFVLMVTNSAWGASLQAPLVSTPPPSFQYTPQQIVNRMDAAMAHPARYTGMFVRAPGIGRLAHVTNCHSPRVALGNAIYACDLIGVPVGTTANLGIVVVSNQVTSVYVSIQNNIKADVGASSVAGMLAEGALINAVDPFAQAHRIATKTHEVLIMNALGPAPPTLNLNKTVRADGLTFAQMMMAGDLVLNVNPTGMQPRP